MANLPSEDHAVVSAVAVSVPAVGLASGTDVKDTYAPPWRPADESVIKVLFDTISSHSTP